MGGKKRGVYFAAIILGFPAIIGIIIFYYVPIIRAVRYSFFDYNMIGDTFNWVGGDNYRQLLHDKHIFHSLKVTVYFFILKVPLLMASGLGLALLVRKARSGVGLLRTIILLPTVTSMVVVSTVWGFMYHPTNGLINSILNTVNLPAQDFLTSKTQALPSIVFLTIWKDVGLTMIFYLAGLMGIPDTYYEAAQIDGANNLQQFWYITLPLLKNTSVFVLLTSTISAFRVFTPIFLTTQGGPMDATNVIVMSIYNHAFRFNEMGYASAISVGLAIILIMISSFQFYTSKPGRKL